MNHAAARRITAIELRHAGSLRRDAAAGRLPRAAAISAIRDCLRHARHARCVAALTAGLALTACAQGPDSIAPVPFPAEAFAQMSCTAARADRAATAERLSALEAQQRSTVASDAVGVFLIGVPMGSLTGGDKAGHIATEKGRLIALDARLAGC